MRYAEDLSQVAPEDMAQLIDRIARESGYDRLVVDVGQMGRGALPILSMCDVVYMPVRGGLYLNRQDRGIRGVPGGRQMMPGSGTESRN